MLKKTKTLPRQATRITPERQSNLAYHAKYFTDSNSNPMRRHSQLMAAGKRAGDHKQGGWRRLVTILVTASLAITVIDNLYLQPKPSVVLTGDFAKSLFLHAPDIYLQAAQHQFSKISNRNKLTINTSKIGRAIQQQFPELSGASVSLPLLGHRPIVYLYVQKPVLMLSKPNGELLAIAQSGEAMASVSNMSRVAVLKLPFVTDQNKILVQPGQAALSEGDVSFIIDTVLQLQAQHIAISGLVLPGAADELDVKISNQPYMIKFNLHSDEKQQLGSFVAVNGYLVGRHITPAEYIDVRVEGRAYYK